MKAEEYFGDWIDKQELRKVVTWINKTNSATLCPLLQIVKEAAINYEIPHNRIEFDNTLESWAKQGILMINTALTCEVGRVGSHFELWKPFVSKLIHNLSYKNNGIVLSLV